MVGIDCTTIDVPALAYAMVAHPIVANRCFRSIAIPRDELAIIDVVSWNHLRQGAPVRDRHDRVDAQPMSR